jgi:hypothetical protein
MLGAWPLAAELLVINSPCVVDFFFLVEKAKQRERKQKRK